MDWLDRVNGAIKYIEENLAGEIDYKAAARIACCTEYQFQRMFSFITDIPLSEYIRRRRLTLAAFELQNTDVRIIDLALKYGYDSPVSFARAFRRLHGVNPASARENGTNLKAYPPISFHISIKGDVEMNYRIEDKNAFSVFGVEEIFTTENGENLRKIPEFWNRVLEDGTIDRIEAASGLKCDGTPGIMPVNAVMCHRETGGSTFPYMICALTPKSGVPEEFTSVQIPALTWAIFTSDEYTPDKTTETIQKLWKRIYSDWFPTSGYEHGNGPEFEMYGSSGKGMKYCEVWIPVVKR